MKIKIYETKKETSFKAAQKAIKILNKAIKEKGQAIFVIATGNSQLDFINTLVADKTVDWSKTIMFHLDEYIGLPETHAASFRKYLKEKFINKVDSLGEVYLINGDKEPEKECQRLNEILENKEIDVSFVGVGENGHLAFNDPLADFKVKKPYIIVDLNKKCRQQQLNEGWFSSLEEVPQKAITMTIWQIMNSKNIINTVPEKRKAEAVEKCFGNFIVSPECPASVLKIKNKAYTFLDKHSASRIEKEYLQLF